MPEGLEGVAPSIPFVNALQISDELQTLQLYLCRSHIAARTLRWENGSAAVTGCGACSRNPLGVTTSAH